MNIAIIYDRVNKFGGAERVLLALHELYPDAPLYTAVYHQSTARWANVFRVVPSFINDIPFSSTHHELFPWLTPLAFESFSFDEYDVVISVTSAEAKNVITKPHTLHVCYCLTPTRYLWSGADTYKQRPGMGAFSSLAKFFLQKVESTLKRWDYIGAQRPDQYIAISQHVKHRIETYYQRHVSAVIYPPVDTKTFIPIKKVTDSKKSFLAVSRLVGYKRIDLLVEAFNKLGVPLTIIGNGTDRTALMKKAYKNIHFINQELTNEELVSYYQRSSAFVFAGQEDFGIAAAEAQACGIPVLCYAKSGMAEIVVPGKTGETFEEQTVECIVDAVRRFESERYKPEDCRTQGLKFDTIVFQKQFRKFIEEQL